MKVKLVDIINIWYSLLALCVIIAPQVERRESLKTKDTWLMLNK